MRIYITKPKLFAKHADKFVALSIEVENATTKQIIVRDQKGDIKAVNTGFLDTYYEEEDLMQELLNNTMLREVAIEQELIEVSDYHYNDNEYLNYSRTHY